MPNKHSLITLKSIDDVKKLYREHPDVRDDSLSCLQSYIVGPNDIIDMTSYQFEFEPYISLAHSLGMDHFGIGSSGKRLYLTHINLGGHTALCTVRPVTFEQVQDMEYLQHLLSNYCGNLERKALKLGEVQL